MTDVAFNEFYDLAEVIETEQEGFITDIPIEDTIKEASNTVSDITEGTADIVENNTNTAASDALTDTLTGFEFQGHSVGATFVNSGTTSFSDSIFGKVSDDLTTLTIGFTGSNYELNIDYPVASGTSYSSISSNYIPIDPSDPTLTSQYRRITDNLSEFFVVEADDQFSSESNTSRIMYLGKATDSTRIPSSGVAYYSSRFDDLMRTSGVTFESSDQMDIKGGILAKDNAILSPASQSMAFIDYNHNVLGGALAGGFEYPVFGDNRYLYQNAAFLANPLHTESFTSSSSFTNNVILDGMVPIILFRGDLETNGTFSNLKLYNNIGFMPEEIVLKTTKDPFSTSSTSTLSATENAAYTFNITDLDDFTGGGQIYGSEAQGIGLHATDNASGLFLAGGFLELNESSNLTSSSATYTGNARGLKINPSTFFATTESSSDFTITPDFTNGTLAGTATFAADTIIIGGSGKSFAISRDIAFAEIESTSLSADSNASFIMTQDLPKAIVSGTSVHSNPADIMWGTWNIVSDAASGYIYPGLHNYWVTGIADAIPTPSESNNFLIYEGGSLGTFVDMNTVAAATGIPNVLSSMSSSKFALEVDASSGAITEMSGIAFSPSGNLIIMKRNASTNPSFSGWATMFSVYGGYTSSTGFFSTTTDALGSFSGSTTSGGQGLFFEYGRTYQGSALETAYGVGALVQTHALADIDTLNYSGYTQGIAMSGGNFSQLITPQTYNSISVTAAAATINFSSTFSFDTTGSPASLTSVSDTINTFISKDAFVSKLTTVGNPDPTGGSPYSTIDAENSFLIGLPGLESMDHISWGMWAIQESGTTNKAFGYMGLGNNAILTDFSDYATANSSSPTVSYSGPAIGSIFDATHTNGVFHSGTAALSIDFSGGTTTGNISIGGLSIDLANITADTVNDRFSGNTSLGGNSITGGLSGSVYGGSAASEAVGSFRASDGANTHAVGAFGASRN